MIVVDASVVAHAITEPSDLGGRARAAIDGGGGLHAPHLIDLEVANFLRKRIAAGTLDDEQTSAALGDLIHLSIRRYPHGPMLPRIWELRDNVTPYDASYIALAEQLGCMLVTSDARLGAVPSARCPIEVLR